MDWNVGYLRRSLWVRSWVLGGGWRAVRRDDGKSMDGNDARRTHWAKRGKAGIEAFARSFVSSLLAPRSLLSLLLSRCHLDPIVPVSSFLTAEISKYVTCPTSTVPHGSKMASSKYIVTPVMEKLKDAEVSSLEEVLMSAIEDSAAIRAKVSSKTL